MTRTRDPHVSKVCKQDENFFSWSFCRNFGGQSNSIGGSTLRNVNYLSEKENIADMWIYLRSNKGKAVRKYEYDVSTWSAP